MLQEYLCENVSCKFFLLYCTDISTKGKTIETETSSILSRAWVWGNGLEWDETKYLVQELMGQILGDDERKQNDKLCRI